MGPLHHPKRRLSVAHDMIGSRRRIVYCKQARQPDSRQSGNKFYNAYKRNKLLRAFSLLKDTQPELRISSKITVQRVFNLPGFPHNQTRTIFSSHCRAMGRTQLLMLWRVDMPLKPSANSHLTFPGFLGDGSILTSQLAAGACKIVTAVEAARR